MLDDPEDERAYSEKWAAIFERQQQFQASNPDRSAWSRGPAFVEALHERLEALRRLHEEGDQLTLLLGVRECAAAGLPMPEWLAVGFCDAYSQIQNREKRSWDEVFGSPFHKGYKIADARMRMKLLSVSTQVDTLLATGEAGTLEEAFNCLVSRGLGSRTTITDAYYGRLGKAHSAKKKKRRKDSEGP